MMNTTNLDPRIGVLASGKFYAFAHGYGQPEKIGTLAEVEAALGIRSTRVKSNDKGCKSFTTWNVTLRFQHPAWDEVDGILYSGISAASKSEAIRIVRLQAAGDGHTSGGRGRYSFTAALPQ